MSLMKELRQKKNGAAILDLVKSNVYSPRFGAPSMILSTLAYAHIVPQSPDSYVIANANNQFVYASCKETAILSSGDNSKITTLSFEGLTLVEGCENIINIKGDFSYLYTNGDSSIIYLNSLNSIIELDGNEHTLVISRPCEFKTGNSGTVVIIDSSDEITKVYKLEVGIDANPNTWYRFNCASKQIDKIDVKNE